MHRKEGMPLRKIAEILKRSYSTIYGWLARVQVEEIGRRHDNKPPGRSKLLNDTQIKKLIADLDAGPESCGFESGLWDTRLVRIHIDKKFGVKYTKTGAFVLLKSLGFSWKKARSKHHKSASKRRQNEFKVASKLAAEKAAQGYTIMMSDSASVELGHNKPEYGWRRDGKKATSPSLLSRQRRHIFGVLSQDEFYFLFYEKANAGSFCNFLGKVHKKFGKSLIFLDNASWHKSKKTVTLLEKYKGDIILEYIPPYTPELNPIEVQWRVIKRVLSARIFDTLKEMEKSVKTMMRKKEIRRVQMAGCYVI